MALSNIWREPRREITESVIGIVAFAAFGWPICLGASWFAKVSGPADAANSNHAPPYFFRFIVGLIGCFLALVAVYFVLKLFLHITHLIGEAVCGILARFGMEPRPKDRYR